VAARSQRNRALLCIDEAGWLSGARRIDSPNQDERPSECSIDLVVVHGISLPPGCFGGGAVIDLFINALCHDAHPYYEQLRELRVSSHFFIRRTGELIQFVSCDKRAWHAGSSLWKGRSRCNDFSIGIELEGADDVAYEGIQYQVCADVIDALRSAYPIADIVGHSDIAPGRKTDPGPFFDWSKLSPPGE
jgi:AmpD protein